MLCENPNCDRLGFTFNCTDYAFVPYDGDSMGTLIEIDDETYPVTVNAYDDGDKKGQLHVVMNLPQIVPGTSAIDLLFAVQEMPENFDFSADPVDGEVLLTSALEYDSAEELKSVMERQIAAARRLLPVINQYVAVAAERGENVNNPYSIDNLMEKED